MSEDDIKKVQKCFLDVTIYFEKLARSRGIQIGLERKLKQTIKEAEELLKSSSHR